MSYCRWSHCDLYIYEAVSGGWAIHDRLGGNYHFRSPGECADKVVELIAAGREVPDYVVNELRADQLALDVPA